MDHIEFRNLEEKDLIVIKEIYDYYILNSTATYHTNPISIDELKEFIFVGHPKYKSFLIFYNEVLAGYCCITQYKKRQAYDRTSEVSIYLINTFHKKGIGQKALSFLEKAAEERGIKNLIGIISGDNLGSIRLFEKCGYIKCAHYKNVGEKFGKILDVVAYQKEI